MYKIDKKNYGFKLTFSDSITAEEMKKWVSDSSTALKSQAQGFGVLIDMRKLRPLTNDAREVMERGQKLYKQAGMKRSAVVVESKILALQFRRLAKETGIDEWERYIDTSTSPNWEQTGVDWLQKALDPDTAVPA